MHGSLPYLGLISSSALLAQTILEVQLNPGAWLTHAGPRSQLAATTHGRPSVAAEAWVGAAWGGVRRGNPTGLAHHPCPAPPCPSVRPTRGGDGWGRGEGRLGEGATVATTDRSRTVILHKPSYFLKHN
ncbi:hypothetical protein E2C01_036282 [Portunus trituberculatus]|uniref:Secreted protein n=1 Tax=Portunus trituberculatus TaxID=210409 RepID=A0A5B7FAY4_PORTR|nr:hypothetical protein [Portunus trituberculatus]